MFYWYKHITGYVLIELSGDTCTQILNFAARNGIPVYSFKWENGCVIGYTTVSGFKRLENAEDNTNIKAKILKKGGFLFLAARYRRRYGIAAGLVLFFAILKAMSLFIWNIDVVAPNGIDELQIIDVCEKIGVRRGMLKAKINPTAAAQKLLMQESGIAWASLNIEGCNLTVNVTKTRTSSDDNTPSNLVADFDGTVERIDVSSGNVLVKVGQNVAKGDVLVAGIIERADKTIFLPSRGTIIAKSSVTFILKEEVNKKISVPTGKKFTVRTLNFFTFNIPLSLKNTSDCLKKDRKEAYLKFNSKALPIGIYSEAYVRVKSQNVTYTEEELKAILEKKAADKIKELCAEDVSEAGSNFSITDNVATLEKTCIVIKNIAKKEAIIIGSGD